MDESTCAAIYSTKTHSTEYMSQAMRILEDIGTEVHSPDMLERLAAAGQRVDGTRVRWDAGFVMERLAEVPSSVAMRGRDPKYSLNIGGGSLIHTPVGGPPFASDLERGRREGTIERPRRTGEDRARQQCAAHAAKRHHGGAGSVVPQPSPGDGLLDPAVERSSVHPLRN